MGAQAAELYPAFGVDPGGVLLGIGRARQDDIGALCPGISVVALIDDEGASQASRVDLVGAQQVDDLDLAFFDTVQHGSDITAVGARRQPQIEARHPRRSRVQDVESVPVLFNQAAALGNLPRGGEHGGAIAASDRALTKNQHRPLRRFQYFTERMAAGGDPLERLGSGA